MKINIYINGEDYSFKYYGKYPELAKKELTREIKKELQAVEELLLLARLRKETITTRLCPHDGDESYIPQVLT